MRQLWTVAHMSTTHFCGTDVEIFPGLSLFVDGNSKVTVGNGSYERPAPNAFSLPHISSCPGSTPACREACYVHGLQAAQPALYARYALNAATLHRLLMSKAAFEASALAFGRWIAQHAAHGFRWHVSGDVMHLRHASWIVSVCACAPDVPFWIYTRTLDAVSLLLGAGNLAVNISADDDNLQHALATAAMYPRARVCYMARSADPAQLPVLPRDSVIFPDYPQRGRELIEPTEHPWWKGLTHEQKRSVCPPDFFGQSKHHRCGPCTKCLRPRQVQL